MPNIKAYIYTFLFIFSSSTFLETLHGYIKSAGQRCSSPRPIASVTEPRSLMLQNGLRMREAATYRERGHFHLCHTKTQRYDLLCLKPISLCHQELKWGPSEQTPQAGQSSKTTTRRKDSPASTVRRAQTESNNGIRDRFWGQLSGIGVDV